MSTSLFLAAVLFAFRWRDVGLNAPLPHTVRLAWLPCLFIAAFLIAAMSLGSAPLAVLGALAVNSLMVGWSEEMMFRGVIFAALRSRLSIWPAIVLTTVLFGAVHVLNGFGTGDWTAAVVQAVTAGMSGLLFVALVIRTGSIIPSMVIHAAWDFSLFLMSASLAGAAAPTPGEPASVGTALLAPLALVLPNFLYALFLLRKVRGPVPAPGLAAG